MKAIRLAMTLGLLSGLASAAFLACGGSESSLDGSDASADGSTSEEEDGGGGSSDRDTGTGNNNTDGGGDAGKDTGSDAKGPSASNPGKVTCGNTTTCNVPAQTCCIAFDGGTSCVEGNAGDCPNNTASARCDEKADCTGSDICCGEADFSIGVGGPKLDGVSSRCTGSCNGPTRKQLCKTSAECPDGGQCVTQTCRGYTISTCGGFRLGDASICE